MKKKSQDKIFQMSTLWRSFNIILNNFDKNQFIVNNAAMNIRVYIYIYFFKLVFPFSSDKHPEV